MYKIVEKLISQFSSTFKFFLKEIYIARIQSYYEEEILWRLLVHIRKELDPCSFRDLLTRGFTPQMRSR